MSCIYFETVLNDFVSKQVVTQFIFPLFSKALWSRINSCYIKLFSNLKQNRHNMIISRSTSNHMGPMYIVTPCKKKGNYRIVDFAVLVDHIVKIKEK